MSLTNELCDGCGEPLTTFIKCLNCEDGVVTYCEPCAAWCNHQHYPKLVEPAPVRTDRERLTE